jgi:DNA polymerase (family 10)
MAAYPLCPADGGFRSFEDSMPVQNAEIAALLDRAAELLEIKGDNPFRTRAYRRAARVVEGLPKSVTNLLSAGEDLAQLPRIGKDLAGKITTIATTGKFDLLEELKRQLPGELGEIAALPGLGPKRVKQLYDQLGVRTIDDLQRAAKAHRLREIRGFGAKLESKIVGRFGQACGREALQVAGRRSGSASAGGASQQGHDRR